MGITTLGNANQYGLTLVLGGGEVNLLQMTGAYSVFANDGLKNPPTGILRIEDNNGNVLEQFATSSTQVLDPQIAREMNDILSDNTARTPEFGADSPLYFPSADVADKTGTTNDYRDAWILGYTPSISVGAWAGNNDNTPMQKKIAAFIVAPMWHEFMQYAITKYPAEPFTPPAPETDFASLPAALQGKWNASPSQGIHEILFWVDKANPRIPRTNSPWTDPQFARWEYPVQLWASQSGTQFVQNAIYDSSVAAPAHAAPSIPFAITNPQNGAIVSSNNALNISVSVPSASTISKVTYYLDTVNAGSSSVPPYTVPVALTSRGPASLRAVATKADGSIWEDTVSFTVQ
jgi:membrane peptidoglycan carboxypeptidase